MNKIKNTEKKLAHKLTKAHEQNLPNELNYDVLKATKEK
jgi:hypothetical protein